MLDLARSQTNHADRRNKKRHALLRTDRPSALGEFSRCVGMSEAGNGRETGRKSPNKNPRYRSPGSRTAIEPFPGQTATNRKDAANTQRLLYIYKDEKCLYHKPMKCCIKRLTPVMPTQQQKPMINGLPPVRISFTISVFSPMAAIAINKKKLRQLFNRGKYVRIHTH